MLVLHGLLGTGRNLRSITTNLCRAAADASGRPFRALLVDLRCHGKSARNVGSLHPPHTLAAAAADVIRLWQHQLHGTAPDVLVGHSLGGKVALEAVAQLSHGCLHQPKHACVWTLDSRPTAVHGPDRSTQEVREEGVRLCRHTSRSLEFPVRS